MVHQIDATILKIIKSQNIHFVRFLWCDNAGIIRCKAVSTRYLNEYLNDVGIAAAQQALPVMYDSPAQDSGLTPTGEVHMRADWSTFKPLPYSPTHARVLTDIYDGEKSWSHCPRSFLRRVIQKAAEMNLGFMAAFENEFYLLNPEIDPPQPIDQTLFAQTFALDKAHSILDEITKALSTQEIYPEMLYAESGTGQFEIPVRFTDILKAADQQIIFRETVRAVAQNQGFIASFVPKILVSQGGNGAHLHISLWQKNKNVTANPNGKSISPLTAAFMAGILHHLPALTAISTPTTNSFKRLKPRSWSGAYACWGYGNREAAIRIPQPAASQSITNIELKTVDPTCNPYLALGAVITAGLDGISKNMKLCESVQLDPATLTETERNIRSIKPLPDNLGQAIEALEKDNVLLKIIGRDLARSFLAVRKAEWNAMKDLKHENEVKLLLERY
ncbi:MAG: glutamine synthetase family protein [Patescibacteria group bacterium]